MKKFTKIGIFILLLIFPIYLTFASSVYDGKFLFENVNHRFYYTNPKDSNIYEITKNNLLTLFKTITIGLKDTEISKILNNKTLLNKYKGKLLLEITGKGKLFYIDFTGTANEIKIRTLESDLSKFSQEITQLDFNAIELIKFDENGNKITNQAVNVFVKSENEPTDISFQKFYDIWNFLKQKYAGKVDYQKMLDGAISGLVSSLGDEYSVYMTKSDSDNFMTQLTGDLEGIGAQMDMKNGFVTVVAPLDNTPAKSAGIKAGDIILEIDNQSTLGMTLEKAVSLIRGQAGTNVVLKVKHLDNTEQIINITRAKIHINNVSHELKDSGIGYIKITSFGLDSYSLMNDAIDDLKSKGADKFIIDLRNNPGGYLDSAIKIAGFWVENNVVVIQQSKTETPDQSFSTGANAKLKNNKTMILVNGGSASASEILAGALQDYKLATIVGEKTFGKGSIQELVNISDGSSLKVTTAFWLTPNKRSIEKNGIIPDVNITIPSDSVIDTQLDYALSTIKN
ncbi:MAG: S41 family peptidase [Patescibacteria group bacterium]|nr:S41 family peptidase [Patescibacteria group bacterium]